MLLFTFGMAAQMTALSLQQRGQTLQGVLAKGKVMP